MFGYTELPDEIINLIKPYIKKGETCKVSGEIELNGKLYKEIIFYKRNLKSFKNEQQGYIYITHDNSVVSSKNIQNELAKLANYYEVFFSGDKGTGILAALQAEGVMETERSHKEDVVRGLGFLAEEGVSDAARIKEVFNSLPDLRVKSNVRINELSERIQQAKEGNQIFNQGLLEILYPAYEDILKLNFEKVKLIGTLADCCDYVKSQAEKKRKTWNIRFKSKLVGPLLRVSDEISYFRRVIRTYEKVLNMNTPQYIKFLNNLNKEKIENRANMVRI
jgi:hypothetical protein